MRFEGTLKEWHAERGFGYIAPQEGGQYLFVHISAFPADGPPPVDDERLSFEIVSSGEGARKQAAHVLRVQQRGAAPKSWLVPPPQRQRAKRRRLGWAACVAIALLLGVGLAYVSGRVAQADGTDRLAGLSQASLRH